MQLERFFDEFDDEVLVSLLISEKWLIFLLCAAVKIAAALLHCKSSDLVTALSTRRIRAGGDDIVQRLTLPQVMSCS